MFSKSNCINEKFLKIANFVTSCLLENLKKLMLFDTMKMATYYLKTNPSEDLKIHVVIFSYIKNLENHHFED